MPQVIDPQAWQSGFFPDFHSGLMDLDIRFSGFLVDEQMIMLSFGIQLFRYGDSSIIKRNRAYLFGEVMGSRAWLTGWQSGADLRGCLGQFLYKSGLN